MASGNISFSWGHWVFLLSSWGSSTLRLLSRCYRDVLVLLSTWSVLCDVLLRAAAVQLLVSVYPLHEYCIIHYWVCQGVGRHTQIHPEVERVPCAVLCYSVSLRWRFGLFKVGCGWWGALLPLIRMTCSTQQYAAIRTYSPSTPP